MSYQDKSGQRVPQVTFKIRENHQWVTRTTDDFFRGKKVVLFALPGAFTPTCSAFHLPSYNQLYDVFRLRGVDDVICLSVDDSEVMNAWKSDEKADKITMLPDGNAELTRKLGFFSNKSDQCLGERSWRYSMLDNDGVIEKIFIEPEGKEEDPYGESTSEKMLLYIDPKSKLPDSITLFTRQGCPFWAKARKLLTSRLMAYEELVLNQEFTVTTVRALSNSTKLPQVFINGKHIGGEKDLEEYLRKSERKFRALA